MSKKKRQNYLNFKDLPAEIGGKLTFFGVLQEYSDDICKRWAESTRKSYFGHYEDLLFPLIPHKPLEDITEDDFVSIIDNLESQGKARKKPYSPSNLNHFRHLLRVVTRAADAKGVCADILWGGSFQEDDSPEHKAIIKVKPRSLSVGEEIKVCQRVLLQPEEAGELLGIAIMFCLGTRNQEACGLDFENFVHEDDDDIGFLRIIASTEHGSNVVKPGGKTFNAPRILPVTGLLLHLLDRRKAFLQKAISAGLIVDPKSGEYASLDKLPIVCRGQNYAERCSSDDLSRTAKALFKEINVDEDIVEEANDLLRQRFANSFDERDVSAYLFRRNFATHMAILGLEVDTIHYLMGHVFENEEITKARFTNGDIIRKIGELMSQRPIINDVSLNDADEIHIAAGKSMSGTKRRSAIFHFDPNSERLDIVALLKAKGASELEISLAYENAPNTGKITLYPEHADITSDISEIETYYKLYRNRLKKATMQPTHPSAAL